MTRQLRLLAAILFALYSSVVFGVGLGELELKSALNQRFDAEIELTSIGALESDEIIANLASQADFERVGVERDYQLTDLRFATRIREDGEYIVQVTSTRPVIEPFLNFIVEVVWPTGRILREYTVLLDPPVFGTDGVERIDPGAIGSSGTGAGSSARSGSGRMSIPAAPRVSSGRDGGVVTKDNEFGMTGKGDTLWTIASQVRPSDDVSVQQTMLALQRANPEAFINNNINLLKAGYVLRIPDLSEIRAETREDALAEVKMQNEEYAGYRADDVTQLDARRTASRDSRGDDATEDGELRLVSSSDRGSRAGGSNARAEELEESLSVAKEDLDRARRANTELNIKLEDLASQLETLNELVQVKDNQLAALKAEVTRLQSQPASSTPAASTANTQQSASASLLSNPMVLGGIGVLAVALIAGGLIFARKRKQAADLEEDDFQLTLDQPEETPAEDDTEEESESEEEAEEDEDVTQQTSDVIGEAEIYIAYGRFPQAISFLQQAIENEPDRSDIQLKLLEVYVQTEDATAFNLQFEQLKRLGDAEATARAGELQAQIPGAVETAAASMDATVVSAEPIAEMEADDDDDLSFDLDDLDAETDDDELSLDSGDDDADELSLDEAMELGEADLDLDLDAAMEEAVQETEEEEMDLDLDLDLDEDIDLEFAEEGGDDTADDDEITLDLSDDDELSLDMGEDDEDALDLGGDDELTLDLSDDDELSLGDDDEITLDLSDDDGALDLGDDLDLGGDLDLDDDDGLDLGDLDLDDDDLGELDLDEDASSKLDLAKAYIEMGDSDGARSLLQEVIGEGTEEEVSAANELLSSLD